MSNASLESLIGPVLPPTEAEVRAICVSSINGKASLDGSSHGLGSPLDFQLLNALRQWSDCVLVGRNTVVAENYFGVRTSEADSASRLARGQSAVPPICVLTSSLDLDPQSQFFTNTFTPPLILVPNDIINEELVAAGGTIVRFSGNPISALKERGFRRILVEGGPSVIGDLLSRSAIDKLHLTLAPHLVWSDEAPLMSGKGKPQQLRLEGCETDATGCVFLRYRVRK